MTPATLLLLAAIKAYDRTTAIQRCPTCGYVWSRQEGDGCPSCPRRRQADRLALLKAPASRGYGYATPDDLRKLGYDPDADRHQDLQRWRHDLELAVEAGLITQEEGDTTWASATKGQNSSTSSTGTTSTTTPTPTTKPSSTGSPSKAAGPPSRPRRKQGNRPSSSPWQFRPHKQDTK